MEKVQPLTGHVSFDTACFVNNDDNLRFKKKYHWIDTQPLMGDRLATVTLDRKTGQPSNIKYGQVRPFICLFKDENGQIKTYSWDPGQHPTWDKPIIKELLAAIDWRLITADQQFNIRIAVMTAFREEAAYQLSLRKGPVIQHYSKWMKSTLSYLRDCPFDELANYPDLPPYHHPSVRPQPDNGDE